MNRSVIIFAGMLLSAHVWMTPAFGEDRKPVASITFAAETVQSVEVSTLGGSIMLMGDATHEGSVEMYAQHSGWSDEKIKQVLEEGYTVTMKVEGGKLYAVAKRKNIIDGQGLSISFRISVPRQVNSQLNTVGGSIQIAHLDGRQEFKTSGGSLKVEDVAGRVIGLTSGGSITVSHAGDQVELTTSGGSIKASDCTGTIRLVTSGGSINLEDLNGTIEVATSGGSIKAEDIRGTLHAATSGGGINLDDLNGTIEVATSGGNIKAEDIRGTLHAATSSGGDVKLEGIHGNVKAKTSGGSLEIEMESVGEYVRLSNKGNLNLTLPAGHGYKLNVKAGNIETEGLEDFRGGTENCNMKGTVGSGGPEIDINTPQRVTLKFE